MNEKPALCVALAAALALASCSSEPEAPWRPPQPIKVEGGKGCFSYARSYMAWGSTPMKSRPAAVLARDGDILGCEENGVFRYRESDGYVLTLAADETTVKLRDHAVGLRLSKKDAGWNWLKETQKKQLARLRFVGFEDDADFSRPLVEKLAEANPHVGLAVNELKLAAQVLPLFHPRALLGGKFLFESDAAALLPQLDRCEFLAIEAPKSEEKNLQRLQFLAKLPKLRSLILINWRPESDGPLPAECRQLRALTVVSEGLKDLSAFGGFTKLQELRLNRCKELADVSALAGLPALKELSLVGCEKVADLAALKKLPELECLSLPPGVTQAQFAEIVTDHPKLRVLELIDCKGVSDLSPLRGLRTLEALVLIGVEAGRAPLYEMKGLRLLVLDKKVFEKSEDEVRKLEDALPTCLVVAGEGMCLGSGWLVLLVPLCGVAWLLSSRWRRRLAA